MARVEPEEGHSRVSTTLAAMQQSSKLGRAGHPSHSVVCAPRGRTRIVASQANPSADETDLLRVCKSTIIKENKWHSSAGQKYATGVGSLNEHLRKSSRPGIAVQLCDQPVDEGLTRHNPHPKIGSALFHLQSHWLQAQPLEHDSNILQRGIDGRNAPGRCRCAG